MIICFLFGFLAIKSKLISTPHVIENDSNDESMDIITISQDDYILMERYYNLVNTSIEDMKVSLVNLNEAIIEKRKYLDNAIYSLLGSAFFSIIYIVKIFSKMKCAKRNCQSWAVYGNYCLQHQGGKRGGSVGINYDEYNLVIDDESMGIRSRRISKSSFAVFSSKISSIENKKPLKIVISSNGEMQNHYRLDKELSTNKVIYISKTRVSKRNAG